MSILNDLFQQIIQSEERIRERFSKIREVNMEIKVYQMKFQDSEDELKSITGSLVLKTQRLAEEELKCKWFGIRESVLREKTIELVNRENCFRNEKEKIEDKIGSERDKFTIEVGKFMGSYDFCERGKEQRVIKAKKMLQELRSEKQRLLKGIALVRKTQEQVASLVREKDELFTITNKGDSTLKALAAQLQTAADETKSLGIDKERMSLIPQNDPEFKRFADELESMKDDTVEGICEALTQELHELQQIHLRNERHKKKRYQQKEKN